MTAKKGRSLTLLQRHPTVMTLPAEFALAVSVVLVRQTLFVPQRAVEGKEGEILDRASKGCPKTTGN